MERPLVSVICACYNQSDFIVESLESVKSQTYPNFELVIWDDASKDNSVEIIEHWIYENPELKITFIKNIENKGICKSLNEAQSLTKGKYIQLLALDDVLLPDKLSHHVKILENSTKNQALVFTDAFLMNEKSQIYQNRFIAYHKKYYNLYSGNYFEDLLKENYIPVMTILFKKQYLDEIGPWDENLVYEDFDMLLRISKIYDFIFDERPSAIYRFHNENTHKKLSQNMQRSLFKIYLKYINYNDTVNKYLLNVVKSLYLQGNLLTENEAYFSINKPRGFFEKWIASNKSVRIYKFLYKINKIKNSIIYFNK